MINDTVALNNNYREKLIEELNNSISKVVCIGLFDKISVSKILTISSFFLTTTFVISSNLRSNIFSMIFFWTKGLVILNGMGRHRNRKFFRFVLFMLFYFNWRKGIAIQSYADYRYFMRYSGRKYFWVPGSGGNIKSKGEIPNMVSIQRDTKINLVSQSLSLIASYYPNRTMFIIGCQNNHSLFLQSNIQSVGYVNSNDIFLNGGIFIQPSGYGEGFPHTLADAIVSGLVVYIDSKEYIRYGLNKLGGKRTSLFDGWSILSGAAIISETINSKNIVQMYMDIIKERI